MGKKSKKKKKEERQASNKSKRQLVLELENASSGEDEDDEDFYASAGASGGSGERGGGGGGSVGRGGSRGGGGSEDESHDDESEAAAPTDFNKKNAELLKTETTVEDEGELWTYPIMCCCKLRSANSAQAFFCACCMVGRAINVALELPYVVNCLCCYCCQPCRRTEIRMKYNINGTACEDCACCLFCPCLVGPQIIGEVLEHEPCQISMCGTATSQPER